MLTEILARGLREVRPRWIWWLTLALSHLEYNNFFIQRKAVKWGILWTSDFWIAVNLSGAVDKIFLIEILPIKSNPLLSWNAVKIGQVFRNSHPVTENKIALNDGENNQDHTRNCVTQMDLTPLRRKEKVRKTERGVIILAKKNQRLWFWKTWFAPGLCKGKREREFKKFIYSSGILLIFHKVDFQS